jgi:hypothetical protein
MITWDTSARDISAPSPYHFTISTDAHTWRFMEKIKELPDDKIAAVIRYDKYLEGVSDAVVGMSIATFAKLLSYHYEAMKHRIIKEE